MTTDVLIIGAGTAGAAAAAACAEAGLDVTCVDRQPLAEAGARWVNAVPAWCFDHASVKRPQGAELLGASPAFHLVAGESRVVVRPSPTLEVDMRALVRRLQADAARHGAKLIGGRPVRAVEIQGDHARVQVGDQQIATRFVIHAAGLAGPDLPGMDKPPAEQICVAAQEVRSVSDVQAARGFFERHEVAAGETLCFTGVAGGYSIMNARLEEHEDGATVSILTGSIPALGHPSGRALLDAFAEREPWVGERRFGGARAIPIGPPAARLSNGPLALLGDAGGQVFAAHGSGIGAGMIAARLLSETLSRGGTPWDYNVAWQRRWGGAKAASALFAQFSSTLGTSEVAGLMRAGLMNERLLAQALRQEATRLSAADVGPIVTGAWGQRRVLRRMVPMLTRLLRLETMHRWYPRDPAALHRWSARRNRLLKIPLLAR